MHVHVRQTYSQCFELVWEWLGWFRLATAILNASASFVSAAVDFCFHPKRHHWLRSAVFVCLADHINHWHCSKPAALEGCCYRPKPVAAASLCVHLNRCLCPEHTVSEGMVLPHSNEVEGSTTSMFVLVLVLSPPRRPSFTSICKCIVCEFLIGCV